MLQQGFNLLRGSLQLDIRGAAIERFLNLCAIHGVSFWNVRTVEPDHFTAWVSVKGYFLLHPYARKAGCRIRICRKKGVPFSANRLTRRTVLWLGGLAAFTAIYLLSGLIWTVEITGNERIRDDELLEMLSDEGVATGAKRSRLNAADIRTALMLREDRLSYLTINFSGTKALVAVRERNPDQVPEEKLPPGDCVSDVTGLVVRLRVRRGDAAVKVGDTVQAGDLIATGTLLREGKEPMYVAALAEADVRTWYTLRAAVPSELSLLQPLDRTKKSVYFTFGTHRFPLLPIEKKRFSWYDKQVKTCDLRPAEAFQWPIALTTELIYSGEAIPAEIDQNALASVLERRMTARLLLEKSGAKLVHSDFTLKIGERGAYVGELRAELIETTGRPVPMKQE